MDFLLIVEEILKNNQKNIVIVAGIHGDEPVGNIVSEKFKNLNNIIVINKINPTGKRRLSGKDLNRHFDKPDSVELNNNLLKKIIKKNPSFVICLHEDDEAVGVYAYCSETIKEKVINCLSQISLPLSKTAHGDKTDRGVICKGKQPYDGTLEKALEKRSIPFCTIETPSTRSLKDRIDCMEKIVKCLIKSHKN